MGQYGNQPDFGTQAALVTKTLDADISSATNLGGACLYVGTAGDINVIISGTTGTPGNFPTVTDAILFKNVPAGSVLPVIVDYVLFTGTSAGDMIALK